MCEWEEERKAEGGGVEGETEKGRKEERKIKVKQCSHV